MRISSAALYALGASLALASLTGSAGANSRAAAVPFTPISFNACPPQPLVFVSDSTPEIYIFTADENPGRFPCGAILGHGLVNPQGLDLDNAGRLYVANSVASNILIFPPPYVNVASIVLPDPGQFPIGVEADCGSSNLVWVTNFTTATGGAGTVTSYTPGGVRTTFADPNVKNEYFPTCDQSGNLYTTYLDNNGVGNVNKFPAGGGVPVTLGIPLLKPGGADFENNVLLVGDQTARTIVPCPGGAPPCGRAILLKKARDPVTFDLNRTDDDLFTADNTVPGYQEYDYASGAFDTSVTIGSHMPFGVAVWYEDHP
jgi:hypothetical protein